MSLTNGYVRIGLRLLLRLVALFLLASCAPEGDSGIAPEPVDPSDPFFVRQGTREALALYHRAHRQEDIDLLDASLKLDDAQTRARRQNDPDLPEPLGLRAFRRLFRSRHMLGAHFLENCLPDVDTVRQSPERFRLTCLEAISAEEPMTLVQRTSVFRTTFDMIREVTGEAASFHIAAVYRDGPLVDVLMRGQVLAGRPVRVEVRARHETVEITHATMEVPETMERQTLQVDGDRWQGVVTAPVRSESESGSEPKLLQLRLSTTSRETLMVVHVYRLQKAGAGGVERIEGTASTRLFAVAVGDDDTVWSGGDECGRLYRVEAETSTAVLANHLLNRPGRVEDLSLDSSGRVHAVVFPPRRQGEHVIIVDEDAVCPAVNALSPDYPLQVPGEMPRSSPSTRVLAAAEQTLWLFGSDGGVAQADLSQTLADTLCEPEAVDYDQHFQRQPEALLSNTVPGLTQAQDGSLWLGTILGVTRLRQGRFHSVPFRIQPALPISEIETLETYFRELAQALFDARPVSTTEIEGVRFDQELIKGDVVSSVVEDTRGRIWVGTWGGGLRRIESGVDTLHLTRQEGLLSNIVFALAAGLDGTVWIATEEGVSRLSETSGEGHIITNFAARDGMPVRNGRSLPVRDVAVDWTGTAWLATDGGLYRIVAQGGQIEGEVHDAQGNAIMGAAVELALIQDGEDNLLETPFQGVTDRAGYFVLVNLPTGTYQLQIDGRLAQGGPYASARRQVEIRSAQAVREGFELSSVDVQLSRVSGDEQSGIVRTEIKPFIITVRDPQGQPLSGIPVTFAVIEGMGTLSSEEVITEDGQAETVLQLGTKAGRVRVEARIGKPQDGLRVRFTALGRPDPADAKLRAVSGLDQEVEAGGFAIPLVTLLEDAFGNPLVGDEIEAREEEGEATFLSAQRITTDAQGEVSFTLQVGETVVIEASAVERQNEVPAVSFQLTTSELTASSRPLSSLAAADFNEDGWLDLVKAQEDATDVSVFLGRGDGTFETQRLFPVGDGPRSASVGDFNGDGRLDVVTANSGSADVSILLGRGDGTFETQRRFPVGDGPRSASVGDFNGDGRLDVVTANSRSADVSVLLGRGDGTFETQCPPLVGDFPQSVAVSDFDGDDRLDLVTANVHSNDVSILLGLGDGTFQNQSRFRVGVAPQSVAVEDFNGDNQPDLVTANFGSLNVSVLLGRGDGTFEDGNRFSVSVSPRSVSVGDFNGDGHLDLVTANDFSPDISVLLGRGDGTFEDENRYSVGNGPVAIAVEDFNEDGQLDLAAANARSDDVLFFPGRGDGTFEDENRFSVGDRPVAIAVEDFNGDGQLDLVTANFVSDDVSVLVGRGDGTFEDENRFSVGNGPVSVAVGDLNEDGRRDLVTAHSFSDDVSVLFGRGDRMFEAQSLLPVGDAPRSVAVGDLNGDGRLDLVTANRDSDDVSILLGLGGGTFNDERRFLVGDSPRSVALGDFNGDGRRDLVTANQNANDVSILLGHGDRMFESQRRFAVGDGPVSVALGDFNRDGRLDLVTANRDSDDVSILLGRVDGIFEVQSPFPVGNAPESVALGDFNGDGRLDLVTANRFSDDVSVLLGRGDGMFEAQALFSAGDSPRSVALGDFNRDGRLDLVTANSFSDDVFILLGLGNGRFITLF